MLLSKIPLKIFGYRLKISLENFVLFVTPLSQLNGCFSFLLMVKYLSFQKFMSMVFLHNLFRIAIIKNVSIKP